MQDNILAVKKRLLVDFSSTTPSPASAAGNALPSRQVRILAKCYLDKLTSQVQIKIVRDINNNNNNNKNVPFNSSVANRSNNNNIRWVCTVVLTEKEKQEKIQVNGQQYN